MQPIAAGAELAAYQKHLQSSHDFRIDVLVMTLNEKPIGSLQFLDGQKNFQGGSLVRSTATLTVSDLDGALSAGSSAPWEGTSLWPDRLVQVRHTVDVPGFGEQTVIAFTGPPSGLSRNGGEVQVELQDKAALGLYGSKPFTVRKGMNAIAAIRSIMASCTGEFRFRLPVNARRLSRSYSVGWTDEASPMRVAARIAAKELGMQLTYAGDGYLICRRSPTQPVTRFEHMLDTPPTSGVDFTQAKNAAYVKGKKVVAFKMAPVAHPLSAAKLARKGVPGWRPVVVSDDSIKKQSGADTRAAQTVQQNLSLEAEASLSVVPMFHHDYDDVVQVGPYRMRMREVSIPFGVGGPMVIGARRWVSRPTMVHSA